jgi:hypothetical protein
MLIDPTSSFTKFRSFTVYPESYDCPSQIQKIHEKARQILKETGEAFCQSNTSGGIPTLRQAKKEVVHVQILRRPHE